MKRFLLGLFLLSCLTMISAQPQQKTTLSPELNAKTIDIEPEQCVKRCYFIRGVPIFCYEVCF